MIEEIERLIGNTFKEGQPRHINDHYAIKKQDLTPMFNDNIRAFKSYLGDDLAPKIAELNKVFFKYQFDSPLDFLMVKSDFKKFFESFT